jgi:nitrogen fixation/metabolism regulation signal transduction histidine kinase
MRKDTFQATFLGLLFMYLALIVLVLLFSTRLIPDLSQGHTTQEWILLLLALFFLLFLLGMVGLNILRLLRDRHSRKPGVRFKVRLVGFFILISAVSSIPQGVLSVSFLNSAVNTIFHPSLREALEGGLSIAITYYDEKIEHIRSIGRNRFAQQVLERPDRGISRAWNDLRSLYPDLSAYQVFSGRGVPLFFAGNTALSLEGQAALSSPEGLSPRETKSGGVTILRFKQVIGTDPNRPIVILSFTLPESFDRNAERITTTLNTFTQLEQHRTRFNATVIIVYSFFAFPLLLLSILVSFLLSDEIIRPIVNIEEATRRVAEGDFSYRILSRSRDDLFHLAESFNRMVTELEKSRRTLVQTEKVTAWQEIAQQLAHEIKNPLTPIKLSAERLLKKYQEDREHFDRILQSSVETILKETHSLDKLLREFKDFSRLPTPVMRPVPLKQIVEEAIQGYKYTPRIRITVDPIPDSFILMADADQIRQMFTNLLTNSIEAMPEGGDIRIRADLVKKGNIRYCRILVSDTGVGISEEYKNLVFNPYFTTKAQGTGLGLSIVERIIFDHKGQIWFESEQGKGTTFFIDLPLESGE